MAIRNCKVEKGVAFVIRAMYLKELPKDRTHQIARYLICSWVFICGKADASKTYESWIAYFLQWNDYLPWKATWAKASRSSPSFFFMKFIPLQTASPISRTRLLQTVAMPTKINSYREILNSQVTSSHLIGYEALHDPTFLPGRGCHGVRFLKYILG